MADPVTSNRSLVTPVVGQDSGTWGGILNSGVMAQLDLILGATQAISITSADVTLSTAQWNNAVIKLSGALTGSHNLILPLNPNSATVAVGGYFVVDNETTGAFNVTVITAAVGSTGVKVPQGVRTWLYSDTTNVWYADDAAVHIQSVNGNPNTQLAGTAATVANPPTPLAFDYSGGTGLWLPTTTGTASTAVWTQVASIGASLPVPEGYLTPVSNTPIITSDSIAGTSIFYTPFTGTWTLIHNGTQIIPFQFSQATLVLTSSQAANGIYDIYAAYNGGVPVIGTGPNWTSGIGGSVTAGSCARGTGAGGAALARVQGVPTNAASMSLIYNTGSGNNTITVAANQGVWLGSIFVDGSAGQVTCHRSYGQSRKWGIWNAYNRAPLYLKAGDSTGTWTYATNTIRASNGNSANSLTTFSGAAEEIYSLGFNQRTQTAGSGITNEATTGIGLNSTTAFTGTQGENFISLGSGTNVTLKVNNQAQYLSPPLLGINTINALENSGLGNTVTFFGGEANMLLNAAWRG